MATPFRAFAVDTTPPIKSLAGHVIRSVNHPELLEQHMNRAQALGLRHGVTQQLADFDAASAKFPNAPSLVTCSYVWTTCLVYRPPGSNSKPCNPSRGTHSPQAPGFPMAVIPMKYPNRDFRVTYCRIVERSNIIFRDMEQWEKDFLQLTGKRHDELNYVRSDSPRHTLPHPENNQRMPLLNYSSVFLRVGASYDFGLQEYPDEFWRTYGVMDKEEQRAEKQQEVQRLSQAEAPTKTSMFYDPDRYEDDETYVEHSTCINVVYH